MLQAPPICLQALQYLDLWTLRTGRMLWPLKYIQFWNWLHPLAWFSKWTPKICMYFFGFFLSKINLIGLWRCACIGKLYFTMQFLIASTVLASQLYNVHSWISFSSKVTPVVSLFSFSKVARSVFFQPCSPWGWATCIFCVFWSHWALAYSLAAWQYPQLTHKDYNYNFVPL